MFDWFRIRNINGFITSGDRLVIYNRSSRSEYWNNVACLLKRREIHMTIVVKKVPKFLRGIVKLIFGIKE